jgi:hypothetical protein
MNLYNAKKVQQGYAKSGSNWAEEVYRKERWEVNFV